MDDNTFECPNCGARVYPEMTRCPQCGHNMYPEDEEPLAADAETTAGWAGTFGAYLIGWMIACGIALVLHFIVASFVSPSMLGVGGQVVLFLSGPVGALVGAYVGAMIARNRPVLLGSIVGLFALPVLVLLNMHWIDVTLHSLLSFWVLLAGLLTILAGVMGGWLYAKFTTETGWQEKWRVRGWEDMLYQDLLRKVRFNGSIADRLIEYERKQDPQASRLKLIQNAIERWERDNR